MAKFTSTIQLQDASEADYEILFSSLKKNSGKSKRHIRLTRMFLNNVMNFIWEGNISLQEIVSAILQILPMSGKKYSFSIVKDQ